MDFIITIVLVFLGGGILCYLSYFTFVNWVYICEFFQADCPKCGEGKLVNDDLHNPGMPSERNIYTCNNCSSQYV